MDSSHWEQECDWDDVSVNCRIFLECKCDWDYYIIAQWEDEYTYPLRGWSMECRWRCKENCSKSIRMPTKLNNYYQAAHDNNTYIPVYVNWTFPMTSAEMTERHPIGTNVPSTIISLSMPIYEQVFGLVIKPILLLHHRSSWAHSLWHVQIAIDWYTSTRSMIIWTVALQIFQYLYSRPGIGKIILSNVEPGITVLQ